MTDQDAKMIAQHVASIRLCRCMLPDDCAACKPKLQRIREIRDSANGGKP